MKVFVSANNDMGHYYLFYFEAQSQQEKKNALKKLRRLFSQDETHHWLLREGYGDEQKKILPPKDKEKWDEFRNNKSPSCSKFIEQMTGIKIHPFKPDLHGGKLLTKLVNAISVYEWR